jgi:hypothetical protein
MSYGYFTMWGALIVMAFGVVLTVIFAGNPIGSIRDAYPPDLARQDALQRCGQTGAEFSRFSRDDRKNCYRVLLSAPRQASSDNIDAR